MSLHIEALAQAMQWENDQRLVTPFVPWHRLDEPAKERWKQRATVVDAEYERRSRATGSFSVDTPASTTVKATGEFKLPTPVATKTLLRIGEVEIEVPPGVTMKIRVYGGRGSGK
jgi:hypothetical protein